MTQSPKFIPARPNEDAAKIPESDLIEFASMSADELLEEYALWGRVLNGTVSRPTMILADAYQRAIEAECERRKVQ